MLVRDVSDSLDVDEVGIRIANGLDVDDARVLLDSLLEDLDALRRVDERRLDAVVREGVLKEVVGAAVDRRSRDDVLAVVCLLYTSMFLRHAHDHPDCPDRGHRRRTLPHPRTTGTRRLPGRR